MKTRKNLTKLALGTLTLIGVGCTDNLEYHFNGEINGEQVRFYEDRNINQLKVKRVDGTKIKYADCSGNDLKLEYVKIKKDGKNKKYSESHPFGKNMLKEAQKQFDAYLDTIKAINYQEALESISK